MADVLYQRGQDSPVGAALAALADRAARAGFSPADRVEGVAIGGCVDAVGTARTGAFRMMAHAHTSPRDRHRGWICIRSARRVLTATGGPSRLLAHEVAHVLVMGGHTPRWKRAVTALGAPSETKAY